MYVVPHATNGCRQPAPCTADRTKMLGANTFHVWGNAYHVAVWRNREAGRREYRIVVNRGHWLVVDSTWEREERLMSRYTQFFVDPHLTEGEHDGEYMVVSEDYADIGDLLPIPGTYREVSRNLTLLDATNLAVSKQRASYSENRRASDGT